MPRKQAAPASKKRKTAAAAKGKAAAGAAAGNKAVAKQRTGLKKYVKSCFDEEYNWERASGMNGDYGAIAYGASYAEFLDANNATIDGLTDEEVSRAVSCSRSSRAAGDF